MCIVFDIEQISSQIVFGGGIRIAFKEFGEHPHISHVGLLRPLFEAVKLKVLLEADEDRRQRLFVDGHSETPQMNATVRRCFEVNIGKSVDSRRNSLCFREEKVKEVMQQNIGEANGVPSITELPR